MYDLAMNKMAKCLSLMKKVYGKENRNVLLYAERLVNLCNVYAMNWIDDKGTVKKDYTHPFCR